MGIAQPLGTDTLNSAGEDHATLHRIIAADTNAPAQSLTIDGNGYIGGAVVSDDITLAADASGLIPTQKAVKNYVDGRTPSGGIILWHGSIASIPVGWYLCDGNNGTPDLRDKFIVGAGSTYTVAETGGEATHTLTITEIPSHTHPYKTGTTDGGNTSMRSSESNNSATTDSAGGGDPHNNLPPFYALAYIMKA